MGRMTGLVGQVLHRVADLAPQRRGGMLEHVGQLDALGSGRHHRTGQARARLAQLKGHQRAAPLAKVLGELAQAVLAQDHARIGAEAATQAGAAQQLLDQLGAALRLLGVVTRSQRGSIMSGVK
jgi:hypothetical protein